MAMHRVTDPAILYFGTPVVLVSTLNPDGTPNLAPMSSAWWLGHHAMLGLSSVSQTTLNLRREGECVSRQGISLFLQGGVGGTEGSGPGNAPSYMGDGSVQGGIIFQFP